MNQKIIEGPKYETLLFIIGLKTIMERDDFPIEKIYTRDKNNDLITFEESYNKILKKRISKLKKKSDPAIFPKIVEYIFVSLMIAIQHSLFETETYFNQDEVKILWNDINVIYQTFEKFNVDATVEDFEQTHAVKAALQALLQSPESLIKLHKSLKKSEGYPEANVYYDFTNKDFDVPSSPYYNFEELRLNTTGVLKILARLGTVKSYKYYNEEIKTSSVAWLVALKIKAKDKKLLVGEDDSESSLTAPFDMPAFVSGKIIETREYIEDEKENNYFATSSLNEVFNY